MTVGQARQTCGSVKLVKFGQVGQVVAVGQQLHRSVGGKQSVGKQLVVCTAWLQQVGKMGRDGQGRWDREMAAHIYR